jgi:hypothetical protein
VTLKYGVLCLFALLIAILLAFKNYEIWMMPLDVPLEKAAPKKSSVKPEGSPPPGEQKDPKAAPSIASYIFIAEKNPFHPDRKEFPVVTAAAPVEVKKPVVRPQVTLFGVTISGDYRSAFISYPGRPLQKGEREVATVKIGDRVGEYKLARILEDRIGLETPEDHFEVLLYDGKTPKKRVYVRTESSTPPAPAGAPPVPSAPGGPPAAAGAPVRGGVAGAPAPTPAAPVVPAPSTPPTSPRSRRWSGAKPSSGANPSGGE